MKKREENLKKIDEREELNDDELEKIVGGAPMGLLFGNIFDPEEYESAN